ncbi:hypothetical protein D3C87_1598930 [compost metagenome]
MHADDAGPEHQAGAVLEPLMKSPCAIAQVSRQQQRRQTGTDGDHDREAEQQRLIVGLSLRTQCRHAHVMHGGDAQADTDGGPEALRQAQLRTAEGVHRQPRSEQGDQQGNEGDGQVVMNSDRRLERQHADEVHGPDSTREAAGADPAPESL